MTPQSSNSHAAKAKKFLSAVKNTIPLWVLGTEEPAHQRGLINTFTQNRHVPEFPETARNLSLLMWTQNPMNKAAITKHIELGGNTIPVGRLRLLKSILDRTATDIPREDLDILLQSGERKLIIRHLFPLLRSAEGLSWLTHCWDTLLRMGSRDLAETALDLAPWTEELNELKKRLNAQFNFLYARPDKALSIVESLDSEIWADWKEYMRCELLLRLGESSKAVGILTDLWRNNPWNINWGHKLHALLNPIDTSTALQTSAEVAILLYSWNNGGLIENTLKNVAESNIGQARVFALNNGSSDNTGTVVADAGRLFSEKRYKGIQLPVNVGAPAARNWLLAEPEVRKSKWAVFLDDDVELPVNWLEELLGTAGQYGNPGAVGCRITSASSPKSLQSADYHIFPPGNGSSQIEGLTERIMVFDSCRNAFDYGQFSYTRPAVHVSGCCHMLNMEAIHKCGDFDVRFNPTQFDDLERDLRAYLNGYTQIYAGQLGIGHIQHSSLAKASNVRGMAQVFGNKIKLESKYSEQDLNTIFGRDLNTLWLDTETKWKELAEGL